MAETKKKLGWYKRWHNTDHHVLAHWAIFLIIVFSAWSILNGKIWDYVLSLTEPGVSIRVTRANAELSLDPQTKVVTVGQAFSVNIKMSTGSGGVDGVDIYSLH